MGYCEFKIPFFKEGISVKTEEMLIGSKHHDELEKIERETTITVPLTRQELKNKKTNLSFVREDINTRFMHEFDFPNGKARITLFGRADKIFRENEILVISDDKHTANPGRHDKMTEPYNDQLLQVLAYLHSKYGLGRTFGGFSEIPHTKKMYRINIVDSRTRSIYKTYEDYVTKNIQNFFLTLYLDLHKSVWNGMN